MDELLSEFLNETGEGLDQLDVELVRFEQEPNNAEMLNTIFRLVHTVKGTCGFLGLTRLAKLAHAAETLMGQYRDGAPVTVEGVSVILASIDRIKEILAGLERDGAEPLGSDADLIGRLQMLALGEPSPIAASGFAPFADAESHPQNGPLQATLDELERAWRAAPGPDPVAPAKELARSGNGSADAEARETQTRTQTVRVSVDTLEHLMTTVSELVLTRNQLLDLVRRTGESEFKSPLQRLSTVTAELQEGIMKARMQPIANAWQKLPRLVRELSLELDKKIELDMTGGETELDRQVLEMIKDPLTHMLRNSADHGLEPAAERANKGKPEIGSDQAQRLSARRLYRHRCRRRWTRARRAEDPRQSGREWPGNAGRGRPLERRGCLQIHLQAGLFHGGGHQRRVGTRRRHGRRAQQYRADRGHRRAQVELPRGHHFHASRFR